MTDYVFLSIESIIALDYVIIMLDYNDRIITLDYFVIIMLLD